ncbi:sensor histidine kinase [Ulvibacter litoralis]|uniref:histidine kinase n=1 Tax=Ulvibacter litoralis TaxID=227084 RepID=A0A1G7CUA8_9FLAO|nr:HAMP domain-containing sensor histidine kinase [Ulvibacter litoralis]GHC46270.1 two-component sensor histidine kinase [Ulvibacter litoralis]SDE42105.1 Signal transduction histidine kinase [Ulvibacter litoralis]
MKNTTISNKLITKLSISFFLIIVLMGITYIVLSIFFGSKFQQETAQKLNANVAEHLIDEKFKDASPFLEDGSVNSPLFGDIMHDMMAVNRAIEVYLLNEQGEILYSVVLDHSNPNEPSKHVDLKPIKEFVASEEKIHILGDDPRNPGEKKIFSAAHYEKDGYQGYIYIVLAGEAYQNVYNSLVSSYFLKLGTAATILTMLFLILLGWLSVWFLTKNLRTVIYHVKRFRDGDIESRIPNAEKSDLATLAVTFNEMADTISRNMEEIKSVDVLRRELIANVSHDLRTPLAVMQGYIETLQIKKHTLSETEQTEYVAIIERNIKQLTKLVSQLFEYSKLEAKQTKPINEPFPITDLIYDIHSNYQGLAREEDIDLKVAVVGETPLVFADISLVERAIQNLMDNAIKFTPSNGVIEIIVAHDAKNVVVKIKDTGPGVAKEDQKYIFERFRQNETSQKKKGIGLGLAIVKKIMELHGTNITITSVPNEGSTFEFYLPAYSLK